MRRSILFVVITVLMFFVGLGFGLGIGYLVGRESKDNDRNITSYQACVDAGGAIMESYPPQCSIDGKTFTDTSVPPVVDPGTPVQPTPNYPDDTDPGTGSGSTGGTTGTSTQAKLTDAYGWSTNAACKSASDCTPGGCGSEICGAKGEDLVSTCIAPVDQKYPKDAGYSCGCVKNQCAWGR